MDDDLEMTDALAEKILSGTVGGALNTPFVWKQKNAPKKKRTPIHVEAVAPIRIDLSCRLDVRLRIGLDNPWEYSVMLLHPRDGAMIRRLDVRGTHRSRDTDAEQYIFRTHKHKWSVDKGNKEVYAPDDIRHNPDPIPEATLDNMDEEYDRVVRDFIAECRMTMGGGYVWVRPPQPAAQQTFDGLEDYP